MLYDRKICSGWSWCEHVVSTQKNRRTQKPQHPLSSYSPFYIFYIFHPSQICQPKKISGPWNFIQLLFSETSNLWNFNPRTGWRIITCKDLTFFKNWLGRIDLKPLDFICLISLYKPSGGGINFWAWAQILAYAEPPAQILSSLVFGVGSEF